MSAPDVAGPDAATLACPSAALSRLADVDPREAMFALLMVRAPDERDDVRELLSKMVYAAIDG